MVKRSRGGGKKDRGEGWEVVRATDSGSASAPRPTGDDEREVVRLRMEKRRGKPVTVLATTGFDAMGLDLLLAELKTKCASGGTRRGSEVEVQGEHRERVAKLLRDRGVQVKGA